MNSAASLWPEHHPELCLCPDTSQLRFTLSPRGKLLRPCWQHTVACKLSYVCSVVIRPGACCWFWVCGWAQGRRGWEECIPNLLNQKRKTAVTSRKESDWNEANQQSVMNSFSLQALFPSPTKENKTKQDTCAPPHKWRGKQSHRDFWSDPGLIPAVLLSASSHTQGSPACKERVLG